MSGDCHERLGGAGMSAWPGPPARCEHPDGIDHDGPCAKKDSPSPPEARECDRTGEAVPEASHCTHWFPQGEVCCQCGATLPHGWWDAREGNPIGTFCGLPVYSDPRVQGWIVTGREQCRPLTEQEHHDGSACFDRNCRFDHPNGGPFPHPCDTGQL